MGDKFTAFVEALLLYALVVTAAAAAEGTGFLGLGRHSGLFTAGILLYLPIIAIALRKGKWEDYGLGKPELARSLRHFFIAMIVVLPVFYWIYFSMHPDTTMVFYLNYHIRLAFMKKYIVNLVLTQTFLIAIPEEIFFRGYLQSKMNQFWQKRWRLLGVPFGPGLILAAALFAIGHLIIEASPMRALVFFPALLFGLLRESTKSVLAPVLAHATCNVTFIIAQTIVNTEILMGFNML